MAKIISLFPKSGDRWNFIYGFVVTGIRSPFPPGFSPSCAGGGLSYLEGSSYRLVFPEILPDNLTTLSPPSLEPCPTPVQFRIWRLTYSGPIPISSVIHALPNYPISTMLTL